MIQHDGQSKKKRKRKLPTALLIGSAISLMGCNGCHSFLLPGSVQETRTIRHNQCFGRESIRWNLCSKRDAREEKSHANAAAVFGNFPAMLAATVTATFLFFGSSVAVASSSGDLPEYLSISERDIQIQSNKKLVDYAVGTVNTQFYDSSGGARFNPSDFYRHWRDVQSKLEAAAEASIAANSNNSGGTKTSLPIVEMGLDTREGTVQTMKYLITTLKDPYSKYMTREELQYELRGSHDGFLGTGAYIEVPKTTEGASLATVASSPQYSSSSSQLPATSFPAKSEQKSTFRANIARERLEKKMSSEKTRHVLLTNTKVANLPVVTAVAPNSPAERAGLVVGDKIVGVGDKDNFLGYGKEEIRKCLGERWGYSDPNSNLVSKLQTKDSSSSRYFGIADLTIAKPVYSYSIEETQESPSSNTLQKYVSSEVLPNESNTRSREIVLGYRSTKVKLPTIATDRTPSSESDGRNQNLRGDGVVQYELLSSATSFSSNILNGATTGDIQTNNNKKVGYIRLTRFSKSSTEGYLAAVRSLEEEGAESYVIDLRNNYGGVIQEAMLTASTLLGDQHAILCYLLNARGGFTPVDVESYVVDPRYPGYLLSKENKLSVLERTMKENPSMFQTISVGDAHDRRRSIGISDELLAKNGGGANNNKRLVANWDPPSSYASIHEQVAKRSIRRITYASLEASDNDRSYGAPSSALTGKSAKETALYRQKMLQQKMLQKDIVLLINEGTASSAEFFVAALQDNGRGTVVGTKSFGKGIIQHTFPMPDGGGLKLTIGEFLRPSLKHVTNAFGVGFIDKTSGEITGGGGVNPDVYCESRQGIPGSPRSDLCVKVALDVLEEERLSKATDGGVASTSDIIARGDR